MLGGQCVLAVDVPGPAPPEEQQGSVLSAALETKTSNPAQHRTDKGTVSSLYYVCVLLSVCVVECVEPVMTNIIFLTPRMRAAPWLLILALI